LPITFLRVRKESEKTDRQPDGRTHRGRERERGREANTETDTDTPPGGSNEGDRLGIKRQVSLQHLPMYLCRTLSPVSSPPY
jgi:hypothetical protein